MRSPVKHALGAMALLSLFGAALPAVAQTTVGEPWVRASVPQQQSTGAFMTLTASTDSKLVGVESPVAKTVQVHQMQMHNDVMSMSEVKALDLPAMTLVYEADPALLAKIKAGDKVRFTAVRKDGKYIVTAISN